MKRKALRYRLVGRCARTGHFLPLKLARSRKASAIVQRIDYR